MSKQLTFPQVTTATKIHADGRQERLRYGQYETVMIAKENGIPVDATVTLQVPRHPVTEVESVDGEKIVFDTPFYCVVHPATH